MSRSTMVWLACAGLLQIASSSTAQEPAAITLRDDLAVYHRGITTTSTEAQRWFDQGLVLYYGFNHQAAIASFKKAAELDPGCAMAWWGQSISAGPHINNPTMDEASAKAAYEAGQQAKKLASHASPVEKALIDAIVTRYAWPMPEDRKSLDVAYSDAMRAVWKQFPKDADVGALFADAAMNLRPWDLWSPEGDPRPETPEIQATIEAVLAMVPDHPMACHEYIHTMEASRTPEKALPAANVLRTRVPGAGHLLHMPGHIDVRVGDYNSAVIANQKGIEADRIFEAQGGFYTIYRAHNFHFLSWAAMYEGRKAIALEGATLIEDKIPVELAKELPDYLDAFKATTVHVMVRFGMWNEILALPKPPVELVAWTAFWHYGRTVSYAALGRVDDAVKEMTLLKRAYDAVPESRTLGNNTARTLLEIALPMAEGELEYRKGNHENAFKLLRTAVQRDVALRYDEPWGWMTPVRHSLGALLLEQNRAAEAEAEYRADLVLHPMNGWALHGLAESLRQQGREKEAAAVDVQFKKAWERADVVIQSSCYCRKGS